jgi:exo-1,4-beta-D-glucosaminidase
MWRSGTAGAWRHYEFDITRFVGREGGNVLAIRVSAPTEKDLAITFVDWNPAPPDKDMGLFGDVSIVSSGPVALRDPAVLSTVDSPHNDNAQLTITARLVNATAESVTGVISGHIGAIRFAKSVTLGAHASNEIRLEPAEYPQLRLSHPQLWWPAQMGTPHLYSLRLQFEAGGHISDQADSHFGIRQITSEVTDPTRRLFRINGKPLLIRGGGWSMDFLLRPNPQRMRQELDYVKDMGLNTIRLEGRPMTQDFYNETDRRGILVMAGWNCCDFWEQWSKWTAEDHEIAAESLRSQMMGLRGHPSLLMWLNGSDNPPPPEQEAAYLKIEHELLWPNPILSSATAKLGMNGAQNGVRMTGPYDYVAPSYWLEDSQANQLGHRCDLGGCGGAHGFNTETSPGPAVPPIESLRKMLGPDHLWPIDATWDFHAGGGVFHDITHYNKALDERYGAAQNAEDYAEKSQLLAYEGIRAMYEGYSRNKYKSTGVIQWMLNNAWPSTIWHLYDYYLGPGGGYFGAKRAMEPLHPIYSYDDGSIWAISSQYQDAKDITLKATIYNLDMQEKFSREVTLDLSADSTRRLFALPQLQGLTPTYFLRLSLLNAAGKIIGSNFYWLSTTQEKIDWAKSNWYVTPISVPADYTSLGKLPNVKVTASIRTETKGYQRVTRVTIRNPSKDLAFFIRLKLDKAHTQEEILPILWEDNYFSLLPEESREITARYSIRDSEPGAPMLEIEGWNVHQ